MKILAIDDERPALYLLKETLDRICPDDTLVTLESAWDFFQMSDRSDFDVAFIDIDLGNVSGIQLAMELKKSSPNCNIIFVTSYAQYAPEAFRTRASGYVLKPYTEEDLREELNNLRNPLPADRVDRSKLRVITFGNFIVYKNENEPMHFSRTRSKEILAYLIDRCGFPVTSRDIANDILEEPFDKQVSKKISKLVAFLLEDLKNAGFRDVVIKQNRQLQINKTRVSCDLYDALNGDMQAFNRFRGEYMMEYSWAEISDSLQRMEEIG